MRPHILLAVSLAGMFAQDMGTVRTLEENKFAPFQGMPACMRGAVQSGDPSKGPSVIVFKAGKGCTIPWHWHTPTEHVMIVDGKVKMEMKGGKTIVFSEGGYARMPSKHVCVCQPELAHLC